MGIKAQFIGESQFEAYRSVISFHGSERMDHHITTQKQTKADGAIVVCHMNHAIRFETFRAVYLRTLLICDLALKIKLYLSPYTVTALSPDLGTESEPGSHSGVNSGRRK